MYSGPFFLKNIDRTGRLLHIFTQSLLNTNTKLTTWNPYYMKKKTDA
jgi:hypothetical protein